jgi:pyridoxal phosphate enzyme (YggS family)
MGSIISIADNLEQVHQRLTLAAEAVHRSSQDIQLLAVSKTMSADIIEEAIAAGQTAFGENYVQEAVEKIQVLNTLHASLEWHLIGPLQSNKTKVVAEYFDWVHSVDRFKLAERLSMQRGELQKALPSLNSLQICVQVNVSEEESKSGVPLSEAKVLCEAIAKLPHLTLRGLMTIPAPNPILSEQVIAFGKVQTCFMDIKRIHAKDTGFEAFDTLSMGMSDDMEAAIAAGSTLIRVGTAIFGKRAKIGT